MSDREALVTWTSKWIRIHWCTQYWVSLYSGQLYPMRKLPEGTIRQPISGWKWGQVTSPHTPDPELCPLTRFSGVDGYWVTSLEQRQEKSVPVNPQESNRGQKRWIDPRWWNGDAGRSSPPPPTKKNQSDSVQLHYEWVPREDTGNPRQSSCHFVSFRGPRQQHTERNYSSIYRIWSNVESRSTCWMVLKGGMWNWEW